MQSELDTLRERYHSLNEEMTSVKVALEDSRSNSDRLHKESELVVQNVNTWVREQKSVFCCDILCIKKIVCEVCI